MLNCSHRQSLDTMSNRALDNLVLHSRLVGYDCEWDNWFWRNKETKSLVQEQAVYQHLCPAWNTKSFILDLLQVLLNRFKFWPFRHWRRTNRWITNRWFTATSSGVSAAGLWSWWQHLYILTLALVTSLASLAWACRAWPSPAHCNAICPKPMFWCIWSAPKICSNCHCRVPLNHEFSSSQHNPTPSSSPDPHWQQPPRIRRVLKQLLQVFPADLCWNIRIARCACSGKCCLYITVQGLRPLQPSQSPSRKPIDPPQPLIDTGHSVVQWVSEFNAESSWLGWIQIQTIQGQPHKL